MFRSYPLLLVVGLLIALFAAAAATFGPQPGAPCDPTLLATQAALFCAPDMPTTQCCEPVIAAVDLGGGVPCLCRVAAEPHLVMDGLNASHLLKFYTSCGGLQDGARLAAACEAKLYKLKHLTKVEVISSDPSGCTFVLGFHNLRNQAVAPPQWTMRNIDDINRLLFCILNICKEILSYLPKVVGIDIVELALWAKENTVTLDNQENNKEGQETSVATQTERKVTAKVTVENDLVSQAKDEEEDMETLLDTYVMGIGEADAFSERLKLGACCFGSS
ncbi:Exocyst complex component SEC3A [Hordeum vulgare]|nr:Exocyst complex component SEC3A [Hordeum vulgare]